MRMWKAWVRACAWLVPKWSSLEPKPPLHEEVAYGPTGSPSGGGMNVATTVTGSVRPLPPQASCTRFWPTLTLSMMTSSPLGEVTPRAAGTGTATAVTVAATPRITASVIRHKNPRRPMVCLRLAAGPHWLKDLLRISISVNRRMPGGSEVFSAHHRDGRAAGVNEQHALTSAERTGALLLLADSAAKAWGSSVPEDSRQDSGLGLADIDNTRPNGARVYDYLIGGKDNFSADREF